MSGAPSRLKSIVNHLTGSGGTLSTASPHLHHLSPTFFLERAAAIEPDAQAVYHVTANNVPLSRTYAELSERARGLAYYLQSRGYRRVGVLAPNTPAFLEAIYGIVAAGGVIVPANYRLKEEDIAYIFEFAEVDCIIVDQEFVHLLDYFQKSNQKVPLLVDTVGVFSTTPEHIADCLGYGCRHWTI